MFLSRRRRALLGGVSWAFATNFNDQAWGFDFQNRRGFLPTLGLELVSNGTFDTDTSGWAGTNAAIASVGGEIVVTATATAFPQARYSFTTIPGRLYYMSGVARRGTTAVSVGVIAQDNTTGSNLGVIASTTSTAATAVFYYFTATSVSTRATLVLNSGSTVVGDTAIFDNISVREVQLFSYGGELLPNGDFSTTDLTGWTGAGGGTGSVVSGEFVVTSSTGAGFPAQVYSLATTVGQLYQFVGKMRRGTAAGVQAVVKDATATTTLATSAYVNSATNVQFMIEWVATTTVSKVQVYISAGTTAIGDTGIFDDLSVRPISIGPRQSAQFTDVFAYTATGTTSRTYVDAAGVLRDMSYDRTNLVRNSTMVGAVAPSTFPTNWSNIVIAGLTHTIVGTGVDSATGLNYIDIRVSGTTSASSTGAFVFEVSGQLPAASGQTVTQSVYVALIAGSPTNVTAFNQGGQERNSSNALTVAYGLPNVTLTSTLTRFSDQRTVSDPTSTSLVPNFRYSVLTGNAVDFTLRIAAPQVEYGATLTGFKATSGTAYTGGVNAPRYDYSNGKQQLLLENAATNGVRNNTAQGGSAAAIPTNWFQSAGTTGLTITRIGAGVENGIDYYEWRVNGTATGTASVTFGFESSNACAALTGQTWTASVYHRISAGSAANINLFKMTVAENDSAGTFVAGAVTNITTPTTAALSTQRPQATRTFTGGATVANAQQSYSLDVTTGAVVDITLRFGLPQLEQSSFASSAIRTTGTAVTRPIETARFSPLVEAILGRSSAGVVVRVGGQRYTLTSSGGRLVGIGSSGAFIRRQSGGLGQVIAQSEAAGTQLVTTANALGWAVANGATLGFDPAGRSMALNGGAPTTDTNTMGPITAVYLGRDGANVAYGDGWFDYVGGQAYRPDNTRLTALAVSA